MTGKSHKAIGTAAGAAIAIYGIRQGDYVFALALVTAPLAAMLPDIDHGSARIGRLRKLIANIIVTAIAVAVVVAAWIHGRFILENYRTVLLVGVGIVIPTLILFKLSQTKWVRETWGFVTKHRGIMHTLIIPICTVIATIFIRDRYFLILTYGFLAGYVSHILADCMTTKGCPILFPVLRRNIRFIKLKTGSDAERIQATIMVIVIILVAFIVPIM
ncbi:MAG: metal-dependent hydrolase [Defluviitaleaceae bacterium]|nr:metal-dependent hydrolase [Defluviitaleaceae bacterium]